MKADIYPLWGNFTVTKSVRKGASTTSAIIIQQLSTQCSECLSAFWAGSGLTWFVLSSVLFERIVFKRRFIALMIWTQGEGGAPFWVGMKPLSYCNLWLEWNISHNIKIEYRPMYMYLPVIKKVPKICWKCMIVIVFWKLRKIWQLIEIWAIYLHKIGFKRGENETYFLGQYLMSTEYNPPG